MCGLCFCLVWREDGWKYDAIFLNSSQNKCAALTLMFTNGVALSSNSSRMLIEITVESVDDNKYEPNIVNCVYLIVSTCVGSKRSWSQWLKWSAERLIHTFRAPVV